MADASNVIGLVLLVASGSFACLSNLQTGEDVCTDRALCVTFIACDYFPCEMDYNPVCSVIPSRGNSCLKRYRNECLFKQAKCRNEDIKKVACPAPSDCCPDVPDGKILVHCHNKTRKG